MTLIFFILVLGITILVHEFGHFIFAKIFNVHVYEFSLGMGKRLFKFKRKNDETEYSIRLFPLGGYVKLAGEEIDDDESIPKEKKLNNKKAWQRFIIYFFGAGFNFIFSILILFISGIIFGSVTTKPVIGEIDSNYPAYQAGIRTGDTVLELNNKKVRTFDDMLLIFSLDTGKEFTFKLKDTNNQIKEVKVNPIKTVVDGNDTYVYGITQNNIRKYGLISSVDYTINKTGSIFRSMYQVLGGLFTGHIGLDSMSGPVGIFTVVGDSARAGIESLMYLLAFIGINVGVINLLPIPAFDGGRILFLIIEKIKGSPVDPKVENIIHNVFFILLMCLMVYVTFNDILRLF